MSSPQKLDCRLVRKSFVPNVERLEALCLPSVTATFVGDVLTITGDEQADTIIISTGDLGTTLLNGALIEGTPTRFNTRSLEIHAGDGNDLIDLSGLLQKRGMCVVRAGNGDDQILAAQATGQGSQRIITGLPLASHFYGDAGNDVILGGFGADEIYGGDGNDDLNGGPGAVADGLWGEAGADKFTPDWRRIYTVY